MEFYRTVCFKINFVQNVRTSLSDRSNLHAANLENLAVIVAVFTASSSVRILGVIRCYNLVFLFFIK
jgi:hypothetical protein